MTSPLRHLLRGSLLALTLLGCGGQSAATPGTTAPDGRTYCESEADCRDARFPGACPGGSVSFAACREGYCFAEGCSSPIGTPCDDDPSTAFDDEQCD
jgi:hypothetical protein